MEQNEKDNLVSDDVMSGYEALNLSIASRVKPQYGARYYRQTYYGYFRHPGKPSFCSTRYQSDSAPRDGK